MFIRNWKRPIVVFGLVTFVVLTVCVYFRSRNNSHLIFDLVLKDMSRVLKAAKFGTAQTRADCWTCQLYNLTGNISSLNYTCVRMKVQPEVLMCAYPWDQTRIMSESFNVINKREEDLLNELKTWFNADPDIGFIDIGANTGAFALPIAAMGRHVLAVEPNPESARRLHKAVVLNHLSDNVTLLVNAVSNQRVPTKLEKSNKNIRPADVRPRIVPRDPTVNFDSVGYAKSIYLNDLLPFCNFNVAVMKIDISGFEHRAFRRADVMFDSVYIPYVQMTWNIVKASGMSRKDEDEYELFMYMIDFLTQRHYAPRMALSGKPLNLKKWKKWPADVVWVKTYVQ